MSAEVDSGGTNPSSKFVRMQSTPEYIPTLTGHVLLTKQHSAKTISSETNGQSAAQTQWGRIKNVAQIQSDLQSETYSEFSDDERENRKPVGVADFQRTAKLFIRSKKVVRKVKTRYRGNAVRKLVERSSSSLDLSEFGTNLDTEMFNNYSLSETHKNMQKQRHFKLAVLQQQFLNKLSCQTEMTLKQRLVKKIEILEKIRKSGTSNGCVLNGFSLPESEEEILPQKKPLTRRQSLLRKSIDQTNMPVDLTTIGPKDQTDYENWNHAGDLTVADIEKELALSRSRQRIESDLKLPEDRMARFALLKANVDKINSKFSTFLKGNKAENREKENDMNEEKMYYVPSRFTRIGMVSSIYFYQHFSNILLVFSL